MVTLAVFDPIELGGGNEPQGTSSQSGMMLPREVLLGLKFTGADYVFAILDQPFDAYPMANST